MLTMKQMVIRKTGSAVPVAELHWPPCHTASLEACLEGGGWALIRLAGSRRAVGQGRGSPTISSESLSGIRETQQ